VRLELGEQRLQGQNALAVLVPLGWARGRAAEFVKGLL
jgi:hypothetical protein